MAAKLVTGCPPRTLVLVSYRAAAQTKAILTLRRIYCYLLRRNE